MVDDDFRYVVEIIERTKEYWPEKKKKDADELIKLMEKLTPKERAEVVRDSIDRLVKRIDKMVKCRKTSINKDKCGNPIQTFFNWMDTPSGVIAFSYIWKPKFGKLMIKLIVATVFAIKSIFSYLQETSK